MNKTEERVAALRAHYPQAWSAHDAAAVGQFYASDAVFVINNGDPMEGRAAIIDMVAGFCTEFPDLNLTLDDFRFARGHAVFFWTVTGHHVETGNYVSFSGWEESEFNEDMQIVRSTGWFDDVDYARQVEGGRA